MVNEVNMMVKYTVANLCESLCDTCIYEDFRYCGLRSVRESDVATEVEYHDRGPVIVRCNRYNPVKKHVEPEYSYGDYIDQGGH